MTLDEASTTLEASITDPVPTTYPVAIATNEKLIADLRARGLIVLDPSDEDVIERAAEAMCVADGRKWDMCFAQGDFMRIARAALAALADGTPA
jgi:hypothetical protein